MKWAIRCRPPVRRACRESSRSALDQNSSDTPTDRQGAMEAELASLWWLRQNVRAGRNVIEGESAQPLTDAERAVSFKREERGAGRNRRSGTRCKLRFRHCRASDPMLDRPAVLPPIIVEVGGEFRRGRSWPNAWRPRIGNQRRTDRPLRRYPRYYAVELRSAVGLVARRGDRKPRSVSPKIVEEGPVRRHCRGWTSWYQG